MNDERTVLRRLLNVFPIEQVRKHWSQGSTLHKDEILDVVVQTRPADEIRRFAKQFFNYTKQNLHIFDLQNLSSALPCLLENCDDLSTPSERAAGEHFYLANLKYKVFVRPQNEEMEVLFKWPVRVVLSRKRMTIRCTTMEKNIRTYFPADVMVIPLARLLEEETIVKEVRDHVHGNAAVAPCDLNKGVKHLWEAEVIDAPALKYKEAKSTISQTMDGEMLVKRDHPEAYARMRLAPLFKTPFFLLKPESKNPPHFAVNPTAGELHFTTFSPSEDHVDYVLGEILKHN